MPDITNTDRKMESIQALRGLAFLGIFLSHASLAFSWSKLAVSIFFVLSGFLLSYKYNDWNDKYGFRERIYFSFQRIRKLYALHIVTMLATLIPFVLLKIENAHTLFIKTVLNVLLLQTWVPIIEINVSLNGVAWFLSVMAFLYFCFPAVAYWLKRCHNTKKLVAVSITIWIILLLTALCFVDCRGIDGRFFTYLTKICPLFRLGDFSIGCIWGWILKINHDQIEENGLNRQKASICEGIIFAAVISVVIIGKQPYNSTIIKWILNPASLYILASLMLVIIFFLKKGALTDRIARSKALIFLGNASGEMFLIHYVVIFYVQSIRNRLLDDNLPFGLWGKLLFAGMELLLTIICTGLWKCKPLI